MTGRNRRTGWSGGVTSVQWRRAGQSTAAVALLLTAALAGPVTAGSGTPSPAPSVGTSTAPISDIEHKICSGVEEVGGQLECRGERDTVPSDATAVHSFLVLDGVESDRSIRWEWYAPSGERQTTVRSTVEAPSSGSATVKIAASINVARGPAADNPGEWSVRIFIGDRITVEYEFNVTERPTATLAYAPTPPSVNESVTIHGKDSVDPDGKIRSYRWDLDGDGTTDATGKTVEHRFEQGGSHDVGLTVVDAYGVTANASREIRVNYPPTGSFEVSPDRPRTNRNATLYASNTSDRDGEVVGYRWDFDADGEVDATGGSVEHVFARAGSNQISLTVVDDDDATTVVNRNVTVYEDSDGDGLLDRNESALGTDPQMPDTDGDGVADGREVDLGADPLALDTDGDGLPDGREVDLGTDLQAPDTDDDGLDDDVEVRASGTDPVEADSDGDGLQDGREVDLGTDPLAPDTDGDGVADGREVDQLGSAPRDVDTDADLLHDEQDPAPTTALVPLGLLQGVFTGVIFLLLRLHW